MSENLTTLQDRLRFAADVLEEACSSNDKITNPELFMWSPISLRAQANFLEMENAE